MSGFTPHRVHFLGKKFRFFNKTVKTWMTSDQKLGPELTCFAFYHCSFGSYF